MRYQVNQELFGIQFSSANDIDNKRIGTYFKPFIMNNAYPVGINMIKLTVTEHHKVPGDYDAPDAEPQYDGFLLTDEKGMVFANQFPRASYGQVSDTSNRRFNIHESSEIDSAQLIEKLKADNSMAYEYNLLTDTLESMRKGIDDLDAFPTTDPHYEEAQEKMGLLQKLLDEIIVQFEQQFPGYVVTLVKEPAFADSKLLWWNCDITKKA